MSARGAPRSAWAAWSWWLSCLLLAAPALLLGWVPLTEPTRHWPALHQHLVLHPDAGLQQPVWVWWTSAWLHGSAQHLWRNLAALLAIALMGHLHQVPPRVTVACLLAWPLAQLGLLLQAPPLRTCIGLSGTLHASVAILATHLLLALPQSRGTRVLGGVLLMGLLAKLVVENPWQNALLQPLGSDISVAPWAHLSGVGAGLLLGGVITGWHRAGRGRQTDT